MTVDGKVVSIPLIGEHSRNAEVTRVQGVKKSVKLIRAHFGHILMGRIWKSENVESQDDKDTCDSQDHDAMAGLNGCDRVRQAI